MVIAILSSIYRSKGVPLKATEITEPFKNEKYPPLLMSRAAALCDIEMWDEAERLAKRLYAMGVTDAGLILNRIKGKR